MRKTIFILLLIPVVVFCKNERKSTSWEPFKYFLGKWEILSKGKPGRAKGEGEFNLLSNGKYLQINGKISFEQNEKNKSGVVNEDFGIFSYDSFKKKYIFRHFQAEGFVIYYVVDSLSSDGKYFRMNSENIENIPPGFKTRITLQIQSENDFVWTFELALPGKEFEVYVDNYFKRKN